MVVLMYASRFAGIVMFTVPPVTEALFGFIPSKRLKLVADPPGTVVGDRMFIVPPLILNTLSGYGSVNEA